nr:proline-rich receptor-like protein kinase PERK10 [Arachis hypogaea]
MRLRDSRIRVDSKSLTPTHAKPYHSVSPRNPPTPLCNLSSPIPQPPPLLVSQPRPPCRYPDRRSTPPTLPPSSSSPSSLSSLPLLPFPPPSTTTKPHCRHPITEPPPLRHHQPPQHNPQPLLLPLLTLIHPNHHIAPCPPWTTAAPPPIAAASPTPPPHSHHLSVPYIYSSAHQVPPNTESLCLIPKEKKKARQLQANGKEENLLPLS